jgi:glycosidase
VIFLDNHDLGRFYYEVGKDLSKFKMGVAFLLTTRGVPQLYYGTEILFDRSGSSHPAVRLDFPGGWPGDPVNAFTAAGRNADQNAAFDYIRTLANWRKVKKVIHRGKLMQFVPEDNVYVYFRYDDREAVMVVMNGNGEAKTIHTRGTPNGLKGYNRAKDVTTGAALSQVDKITIPARTALVLELER